MRIRTERDLTCGSVAGNIWHLALPPMVATALQDIVDMIFVGRLGPQAIAAVSIGGVIIGMVRMVGMGISTGTVALISRFVGAGDRERARVVLGQSTMSTVSAAVIAVAGIRLVATKKNGHESFFARIAKAGSFSALRMLSMNVSRLALGRAMDGAGSTRVPMITTFVALIVLGIPMAWVFSTVWA